MLIQFIHSFDICICFTNTGLHFNSQIICAFQLRRRLYLIVSLYFLNVIQDNLIIKLRYNTLITPTCKIRFIKHIRLRICLTRFLHLSLISSIHHVRRSQIWLSRKNVYYRFCSISLKLLMLKL